jgi:hypothetical protein
MKVTDRICKRDLKFEGKTILEKDKSYTTTTEIKNGTIAVFSFAGWFRCSIDWFKKVCTNKKANPPGL